MSTSDDDLDFSAIDGPTLSVDDHYRYGEETRVYSQEGDALDERETVNDTADDVDPRKLVRDPTVSEVRWYYRNHPFGQTAVDKPVDDAFKHGFVVTNDPSGKAEAFLDQYVPVQKRARKKARRDGFAVVQFVYDDTGTIRESPYDSDVRVRGLEDMRVLTLDDFDDNVSRLTAEEYVDYEYWQLEVVEPGVVVVDDISSVDHGDIVGYVYEDPDDIADRDEDDDLIGRDFIHADRCQHFVHMPTVDMDYGHKAFGHVTGHPVLGPVFHVMKALAKADWALGQTLFRHTSPLHTVETPMEAGVDEDHIEALNDELNNLNAASSVTLPPGHEMDTHGANDELNPEPHIDALVEQFCAGVEMTKSVLQGSQTGTVSGSETDIKNYFNQVERYRETTAIEKMHEAADMVFRADPRTLPSFALGFGIDWEPLFKLDRLDRTEAMTRVSQAVSQGINNYYLSHEEARAILQEQWATLDVAADLDGGLSEDELDVLDRINHAQQGALGGGQEAETEVGGNPAVGQNGGGMERGQSTAEGDPT